MIHKKQINPFLISSDSPVASNESSVKRYKIDKLELISNNEKKIEREESFNSTENKEEEDELKLFVQSINQIIENEKLKSKVIKENTIIQPDKKDTTLNIDRIGVNVMKEIVDKKQPKENKNKPIIQNNKKIQFLINSGKIFQELNIQFETQIKTLNQQNKNIDFDELSTYIDKYTKVIKEYVDDIKEKTYFESILETKLYRQISCLWQLIDILYIKENNDKQLKVLVLTWLKQNFEDSSIVDSNNLLKLDKPENDSKFIGTILRCLIYGNNEIAIKLLSKIKKDNIVDYLVELIKELNTVTLDESKNKEIKEKRIKEWKKKKELNVLNIDDIFNYKKGIIDIIELLIIETRNPKNLFCILIDYEISLMGSMSYFLRFYFDKINKKGFGTLIQFINKFVKKNQFVIGKENNNKENELFNNCIQQLLCNESEKFIKNMDEYPIWFQLHFIDLMEKKMIINKENNLSEMLNRKSIIEKRELNIQKYIESNLILTNDIEKTKEINYNEYLNIMFFYISNLDCTLLSNLFMITDKIELINNSNLIVFINQLLLLSLKYKLIYLHDYICKKVIAYFKREENEVYYILYKGQVKNPHLIKDD
ncbi:hypothetical protein K502DRAFT_326139 [Neoconidiobolus thromboides FSU 785]|nr:hypothetical protein K502DRAFT_326139 [Neoconidiobolus thromboides FSU 785]